MASTRVRDTVIDPAFPVPPGVVDVRQLNRQDGSQYYDPEDIAVEGATLATSESVIAMPVTYTIYEQRVRISSDGRAVVDVTLDFPDVPGLVDVEVQVTKI